MTEPRVGHERRSSTTFGVVIGLVIGVFMTMLTVPKREDTVVTGRDGQDHAQGLVGVEGADVPLEGAGAGAGAGGGIKGGGGQGPASAASGAGRSSGNTSPGASRGVTPNSVKIGILFPDTSATERVSSTLSAGNVPQQWDAIRDRWKREGLIPVHGRDVVFVYESFTPLTDERPGCVAMAQDHKVFAVAMGAGAVSAPECLAREFRMPVVVSEPVSEGAFERSKPYLFTLPMSLDRTLRNWMYWAHHAGLLKGKKLGLYYNAAEQALISSTVKSSLQKLGYRLTEEVTTDSTNGGPQDAVAAQRFRLAGVEVAILVTTPFVKASFMQQAEAQAYRPAYIETDYANGTSDQFTPLYPPAQFAGTQAMTGRRVAEPAAGMPTPPETAQCLANYERFAQRKVKPESESGEWSWTLYSCDLSKAILHALRQAGPGLAPSSFTVGLETVQDMFMNRWADATFTPAKHHGGQSQRTLRWDLGCRCWKAAGQFTSLWVP